MIFMKCGHVANAEDENGQPYCGICIDDPTAKEVARDIPELSERKAVCVSCGKEEVSSPELPFFRILFDKTHDEFRCGCHPWDD